MVNEDNPPTQQDDDQSPRDPFDTAPVEQGSELCGWVMKYVNEWRTIRDNKHRAKWDEFVRIWKGEWAAEDKNRKSERSKIITPASMQALDSTVSEIEEALFRRDIWFDVDEDLDEMQDIQQREEMLAARDRLLDLCEEEKVPANVAKLVLIGALYGTGVGKVNVYMKPIRSLQQSEDGTRQVITQEEARVEFIPLEPYEFVPDPTTDDLDRMLGMAHETIMPYHEVKAGMKDGRYRNTVCGMWSPTASDPMQKSGILEAAAPVVEGVKICEWHGKVPARLLALYLEPDDPLVREMAAEETDYDNLVEAIVTIANEGKVIAAKASPFMMQDRSFVAYQHDTIPGYFWGRGVIEKAYNAQKALDADVRARIDHLAIVANPMVAGDVTRLPRGMNLAVWPGKFWPTTGVPGDVLQGFQFGQVDSNLFNNASDMERMVQTATGAMDPGAGYSGADGAQDRALMGAPFIKRARRTMQNIERNLMQPMIRKFMWRYVQFSPLFPQDFKFTVSGTLGVMAREIEQQQLTQLLSLVPNESKPFFAMLRAVFDNSSIAQKGPVLKALDEMLNPPPDPEAQQKAKFMEELQMRGMVAEVEEKEAKALESKGKAREAEAKAILAEAQARVAPIEAQAEMLKVANDAEEVRQFARQNDISEQGMDLKAFDLALRAEKLPAEVDKLEAEAADIRRGPSD
jgi:hypothetical protein